MQNKTKIVYSAKLAKELLRKGYRIVDIDPNKEDTTRTVFFFLLEDGLVNLIKSFQCK